MTVVSDTQIVLTPLDEAQQRVEHAHREHAAAERDVELAEAHIADHGGLGHCSDRLVGRLMRAHERALLARTDINRAEKAARQRSRHAERRAAPMIEATRNGVAIVVEEDHATRVFVVDNLIADGFEVHAAANATAGMVIAAERIPDIAVVAVNGGSGRDFARLVRSGETGVDKRLGMILLGGDRHELDTLRALDAGADDYLAKPFSYPELHGRIVALLRRIELDRPTREVRRVGPLTINRATRVVTVDGRPTDPLSGKEFRLLWLLATDPERVYGKAELIRAGALKAGGGATRTLDSHACRIRGKLTAVGDGSQRFIVNVWGVGYRLMDLTEATS